MTQKKNRKKSNFGKTYLKNENETHTHIPSENHISTWVIFWCAFLFVLESFAATPHLLALRTICNVFCFLFKQNTEQNHHHHQSNCFNFFFYFLFLFLYLNNFSCFWIFFVFVFCQMFVFSFLFLFFSGGHPTSSQPFPWQMCLLVSISLFSVFAKFPFQNVSKCLRK